MQETYWQRQDTNNPLFGDILWSRPENKLAGGKLLIIGGNLHGFGSVGQAYQVSMKAEVGTAKVLLPDALKKTIGKILENGEFAPSTPSGSFAQSALAGWLDFAAWADAVLIVGDLGRSSETAILLEHFVEGYSGQLIMTKDAIDNFYASPKRLLDRPKTTLVASMGQLQKLATAANSTEAISTSLDLLRLIEVLHNFEQTYSANLISQHLGTTLVAAEGKLSTTKNGTDDSTWCVENAAKVAVLWLQNPNKAFEALTTAQVL